ncbi:hypothetical protein ACWD2L_23600 [Streptomyces sp. NPDC002754]
MTLRFIGTTSDHGNCPTLYEVEETGEILVQGEIETDPEHLAQPLEPVTVHQDRRGLWILCGLRSQERPSGDLTEGPLTCYLCSVGADGFEPPTFCL